MGNTFETGFYNFIGSLPFSWQVEAQQQQARAAAAQMCI